MPGLVPGIFFAVEGTAADFVYSVASANYQIANTGAGISMNRRLASVILAIAITSVGQPASAYNYHLDRDIQNLLAEGTSLTHRYQSAEQDRLTLMQQKQDIDNKARRLDAEQAAYEKNAQQHDQRVTDQNKALQDTKQQCNNRGGSDNTSGHVNRCDNRARTLNAQSKDINSEVAKLDAQKAVVAEQTTAFNQATLAWNRHQMVAVSVFNDASQRLNDWLDRAYAFMNTSDFQGNIAWAHAGKRCADYASEKNVTPEQALLDQARHALNCLNEVKKARQKYYGKPS